MKKTMLFVAMLAMAALMPSHVEAVKWSDPQVVFSKQRIKLGDTFKVEYYNAPSGASIVAYPNLKTPADAVATVAVNAGKGSTFITIPSSAEAHGYTIALVKGTGASATLLSAPKLLVADAIGTGFKMTVSSDYSAARSSFKVEWDNAPATGNDIIAVYPISYAVQPYYSNCFEAPTVQVKVNSASGSQNISVASPGYYYVRYFVDGSYKCMSDSALILIGQPATVNTSATTIVPEQDLVINYTAASKTYTDWIGVFPADSSTATCPPIWRADFNRHKTGSVTVPSGTLVDGKYKIQMFFNNTRNASSQYKRITVKSGAKSPQYSNDSVHYYYTIVSPVGNLAMVSESSSMSLANMKLVSQNASAHNQQWMLKKREDGRVDIINRSTGAYITNQCAAGTLYNLAKIGKVDDTYQGWGLSLINGKDQWAIHGVGADGVDRHLINATTTEAYTPFSVVENSKFAWRLTMVEAKVTGVNGVAASNESVKVNNGHIVVSGNQNYTICNVEGVQFDKNATLIPGIYIVKWNDGKAIKVAVN